MLGDDKDSILKMGSCSSVDKGTDSTVKYRLCVKYRGRRFFIPSPAKEKPLDGQKPVGEYGSKSLDFESNKEEIFFDSRSWPDSDCEDDFFSVNGEFTPSRGSTPIHQLNAPLTPRLGDSFAVDKYPDSKSEPSPTGRKKLGELFRETLEVEQEVNVPNASEAEANKKLDLYTTDSDRPSRSLNGETLCHAGGSSFCSSEVIQSRDPRKRKEKIWKTQQCCLPSLQSFGFDDRRQKMRPDPCAA